MILICPSGKNELLKLVKSLKLTQKKKKRRKKKEYLNLKFKANMLEDKIIHQSTFFKISKMTPHFLLTSPLQQ
jgi:hypothetical protein